jgi:hypothetical protein
MAVAAYRSVTWQEFCDWVQAKRVASTKSLSEGRVQIVFADGTEAIVASDYDEGYSEMTPGDGLQEPTVSVWGEHACDACGKSSLVVEAAKQARDTGAPVRVTCPKCGGGRWLTSDKVT